ncbi:hypothetical protein EBS67_00220 [bacterium]|nr:hypothetical protein [bacterium]
MHFIQEVIPFAFRLGIAHLDGMEQLLLQCLQIMDILRLQQATAQLSQFMLVNIRMLLRILQEQRRNPETPLPDLVQDGQYRTLRSDQSLFLPEAFPLFGEEQSKPLSAPLS